MIRQFDLAIDEGAVERLLNDPKYQIIKCDVQCSEKTGYTTATLHTRRTREAMRRKRRRKLARFLLLNGTNTKMNEVLEDENYKVLRIFEFTNEHGVIIVLDYEFLKERS